MSRTAARSADSTSGIKVVAALAFVLAMAVVVLILVRARPAPEPFDPRSGRADGARGLVVTLQELGGRVEVTRSVPVDVGSTLVLVLDDRLDDRQRMDLVDFAEFGGTVVVADPESTLHGGAGLDGGAEPITGFGLPDRRLPIALERNLAPGECTIDALLAARGLYVPDGLLFPVGPDEPRCFTGNGSDPETSFVIVRELGTGTVVGLGDNEVFVNRHLRRADNAVLAAGLLLDPSTSTAAGGPSVTILIGNGAAPTVDDIGTGDDSLFDLVPSWVWMTLALGAVAFVVFAISSSARVGRIVSEPFAVPIAGSELVSATGNLMERAGHAARAGWLIQSRLHRELCDAHDVALSAPLAELDRAVSNRAGTQPGEVEALLRTQVGNDADLVALHHRAIALRRTVLNPRERVPS